MYGEEVIEFQVLPELDKILEEIKRLSGLSDLTWVDDRKTKLIHPEFTKREFSLLVDGNTIRLARGWIDKWYLLDVVLVALVNLGGRYDHQLSETGRKKWVDVKNEYPEVKDWHELDAG